MLSCVQRGIGRDQDPRGPRSGKLGIPIHKIPAAVLVKLLQKLDQSAGVFSHPPAKKKKKKKKKEKKKGEEY